MKSPKNPLRSTERAIKRIGYHPALSGHERRKLGIFNMLNVTFGITLGMIIPLNTLLAGTRMLLIQWAIFSGGPMSIAVATAILTRRRRFELARTAFFILHPLLLATVHLFNIDAGTDLFFICFGVLSVFFLQNIQSVIFTFSLSLTCYFVSLGIVKTSGHNPEIPQIDLFLFNRLLAIFFIFYGIFIIRNENSRYQHLILDKNRELHFRNDRIESQKREMQQKTQQLQLQALQLSDLNALKNRLFSIISHDLRGPLYAMYTLFKNFVELNVPPEEITELLPDIARDLAQTTGNVENLLQWAKGQMHSENATPQIVDISKMIRDILSFLRLQLEQKKLRIHSELEPPVYVFADREMINVVLRNLLSNAIKFTPEAGVITLGTMEHHAAIEVFVRDSGSGISGETITKIDQNIYYTTRGTANESGTGLGLMLCKDFLIRNGSKLRIESEPGKGSTFSFKLPRADS